MKDKRPHYYPESGTLGVISTVTTDYSVELTINYVLCGDNIL